MPMAPRWHPGFGTGARWNVNSDTGGSERMGPFKIHGLGKGCLVWMCRSCSAQRTLLLGDSKMSGKDTIARCLILVPPGAGA